MTYQASPILRHSCNRPHVHVFVLLSARRTLQSCSFPVNSACVGMTLVCALPVKRVSGIRTGDLSVLGTVDSLIPLRILNAVHSIPHGGKV